MGSISGPLVEVIRARFALDWHGGHGAAHWARVRAIGLRIAEKAGGRADVVELFAFLHDAARERNGNEPDHGRRAAELARELRGSVFALDDEGLALLTEACEGHSAGRLSDNPTVSACWDADRLDLARFGVHPNAALLSTSAARHPEMIGWALDMGRRWRARRKGPAFDPARHVQYRGRRYPVTAAGTVFVLRTNDAECKGHGGFQWPARGEVSTDNPLGLFGQLWGDPGPGRSMHSYAPDALWQVVEVRADELGLDGPCQVTFPRGVVVHTGTRQSALEYLANRGGDLATLPGRVATGGDGDIVAVGYAGLATAGADGLASAGARAVALAGEGGCAVAGGSGVALVGRGGRAVVAERGVALSGDDGEAFATMGRAFAGDRGSAQTTGSVAVAGVGGRAVVHMGGVALAGIAGAAVAGREGMAIAGAGGRASAGVRGVAVVGPGGSAMAEVGGALVGWWWDVFAQRVRVVVGHVGEDDLEPGAFYRIEAGRFVRAE